MGEKTVLDYARENIILLETQSKKPVFTDWVAQPAKINGDAGLYLDIGYNLGFRIPRDHLVIDVDPRAGGDLSYLELPPEVQALPITTISPSGGWHIYTRLPDGVDYRNLRTKLNDEYPGIDFLHYGAQVVLPGSSLAPTLHWKPGPAATVPPPLTPAALLDILTRQVRESAPVDMQFYLTDLELDSVLSAIPVTQYRDNDSWLRLAMACHHATNGRGLPSFLAWSVTDPMYADQSEIIRRRWESMSTDNTPIPITVRTLIKELTQHAPAPSWLLARAGITSSPEEFFNKISDTADKAHVAYDALRAQIDNTSDQLTLLTAVLTKIALESAITESMREILLRRIADRTGSSLTSLKRDIKILTAPQFAGADLEAEGDAAEPQQGANLAQPHTAAAQTAIAALSIDGTPPAYCMGDWFRWDGRLWDRSRAALDIRREAHKALYNQGTAVTGSAIRSVVDIMQTLMEINPAAFQPKPEEIKIFTPLRTLEYTKDGWKFHTPNARQRNTTVTGVIHDEQAPVPPEWLKFLKETTTSEQAQRTIAVSIIYAASFCRPWLRKAIYVYGPRRSGKSTLLDTIEALLGHGNCSALNVRQLGAEHGTASLVGKLANISNETVSQAVLQDDTFKALVSGESVQINPKNKPLFRYANTAKLFFAANNFARVKDESEATWDRLAIISCPYERKRQACDTTLGPRLRRLLPGILNWAMQIFHEEYQKDACASAMEMDPAAEAIMCTWREINNPALRWLRERTANDPGKVLPVSAAYTDYCHWCDAQGHKRLNLVHFGRQISKEIPDRVRQRGAAHLPDMVLLPLEETPFNTKGGE